MDKSHHGNYIYDFIYVNFTWIDTIILIIMGISTMMDIVRTREEMLV